KATFKFDSATAKEVLEKLQKECGDIHIQASVKGEQWSQKLTATLTDSTAAAALQLLEDALGSHRIVVREYGLLIVPNDKVPTGAMTLTEFLKAAPTPTPSSVPK